MALSAKALLQTTVVKDIIHEQEVVYTRSNDGIARALELLTTNGVTSLPVYDVKEDRFNSFVSFLDLCCFTMKIYNDPKISDKAEAWKGETSGKVANMSKTCAYQSLRNTDNLRTAMLKMVSLSNIRRMPVVNIQDDLVGILTQSQIINILSSKIDTFPIANHAIEDLSIGTLRTIKSVTLESSVKDAFNLLVEYHVYGIPVVDDKNVVVGNISASDIQLVVSTGDFSKLDMPVKNILPETHQKRSPIVIQPSQTISDAFKIMSKEKIHRLFVVDKKNCLIGLISPVDLIQLLLDHTA